MSLKQINHDQYSYIHQQLFHFYPDVIILIQNLTMIITSSAAHKENYGQTHPKRQPTSHLKTACPEEQDSAQRRTKETVPCSQENILPSSRAERSETCHFKIRPINAKKQPLTSSIEGKRIENCHPQGSNKAELKDTIFVIKRFSIRSSPIRNKDSLHENAGKLNPSLIENNAFHAINLFKPIEKAQLHFQSHILQALLPLSHSPQVKLNPLSPTEPANRFLVVVSFHLLCPESLKYGRPKTMSSHKNIEDSLFSGETRNLLQKLSGSQGPKSFLNRCRLFYKTRSQYEVETLENYLQENKLNNYEGIINVRDNFMEEFNCYTLKGVASKDSYCLLVENEQVLRHELPVLDGIESVVLGPAVCNYQGVARLIQSIKGIRVEQPKQSPQKSPHKMFKRAGLPSQENFNPNLDFGGKSPSKLSPSKSISPQKKSPLKKVSAKPVEQLLFSGNVHAAAVELEMDKLMQRVKCSVEGKQLRQACRATSKSIRGNSSEKLKMPRTSSREKSCGRLREETSLNDHAINLEGDYKDKMVTFVKILDAERKAKVVKKPAERRQGRFNDELEQITCCLASGLKSKTSYQMVGELLRNNSHIAKQVSKYLSRMGPYQRLLGKIGPSQSGVSLRPVGSLEAESLPFYLCS